MKFVPVHNLVAPDTLEHAMKCRCSVCLVLLYNPLFFLHEVVGEA